MQIVGYEAAVEGPAALRVAEEGRVRREPLAPGTDLAYALGDRHCAGVVRDGVHEPCGAAAAPRCSDHVTPWPCARCVGDCAMPIEACHEEHAIYLAAFAPDTFKVGVTRSWRLERRLREQGADRGAHVRTVSNGRIAREIEARIARERGIPDRIRVDAKVAGLDRTVDAPAWRDLLAGFDVLDALAFDYDLTLDRRPVAATLLSGRVRGSKGRLLVVERAGTTYAVDMRALVGHELAAGDPDREFQASLGAFG